MRSLFIYVYCLTTVQLYGTHGLCISLFGQKVQKMRNFKLETTNFILSIFFHFHTFTTLTPSHKSISRYQYNFYRWTTISGGSRISSRGTPTSWGGTNSRGGYVSKNLYVKTNESGPLGGGACRWRPMDPPMTMA